MNFYVLADEKASQSCLVRSPSCVGIFPNFSFSLLQRNIAGALSSFALRRIINKLGLSRAELSQARNCLEVLSLHFFELSAYHLKVTLSAFGLASEILIGLAN